MKIKEQERGAKLMNLMMETYGGKMTKKNGKGKNKRKQVQGKG
jgi:hypothetical protein